jgi:hypothetical protein
VIAVMYGLWWPVAAAKGCCVCLCNLLLLLLRALTAASSRYTTALTANDLTCTETTCLTDACWALIVLYADHLFSKHASKPHRKTQALACNWYRTHACSCVHEPIIMHNHW